MFKTNAVDKQSGLFHLYLNVSHEDVITMRTFDIFIIMLICSGSFVVYSRLSNNERRNIIHK